MSLAKPTPYGNAEDLAMINRSLVAQLRKERATIQRVRDLHEPEESDAFPACPEGCCGWCAGCGLPTPCPTILALDGAGQ